MNYYVVALLFTSSALAGPTLQSGFQPICAVRLDTVRPAKDWGGHSTGENKKPEDRMTFKQFNIHGQPLAVHGVFDGHGGADVAQWLEDHLADRIAYAFDEVKPETPEETSKTITGVVYNADKHLCSEYAMEQAEKIRQHDPAFTNKYSFISGSTASFVVQWLNKAYIVQIGDSATMVYVNEKPTFKTKDHKPNVPDEKSHIESRGGQVRRGRFGSMMSQISISRTFGNCELKRTQDQSHELLFGGRNDLFAEEYSGTDGMMRVQPDIDVISIEQGQQYTFLTMSDGVFEDNSWDRGRPIAEEIDRLIAAGTGPEFCQKLAQLARDEKRSEDDISVMVARNQ